MPGWSSSDTPIRTRVTYDTDDYAPLSFERPEPINHIDLGTEITDPIEGRAACHIAPAEWRLLGWLEREQFDYDYYAETQLHDGTLDLDAYKVLIISHASRILVADDVLRGQVVGSRARRQAHVSGWKRAQLRGRVRRFHHRDLPQWRCPRRQARRLREPVSMRVESEANLLGVVFSETGIMTGAPYRVLNADHWAFDGTNLKDGDLFGESSLHMRCPGGASGHETDKVSPSSPENVVRLAKGTNIDDGGAELVYYRDLQRRRGLFGRLDRVAQRDLGR